MQPQGSFSFLQTGQQDGQHGFLHMETVLGLVKDLVGVLFKDSGGDKASGSTLGQLLNIDYNWDELNVFSRTSYDVEDCIQPLMAMSKCAAPEIEPVDIDVTDTVAFTWEIQ